MKIFSSHIYTMKVFTLRRFGLAILFLALQSALIRAQTTATTSPDFNNVGSSGAVFEKIGVGARAAGMGGAFSALADDITALYWNPAGIARLKGINAGASYTAWFAGITHNFIAGVVPISDRYRFGVSLTVLDNGSLSKATIDKDANSGTFNANDLALA